MEWLTVTAYVSFSLLMSTKSKDKIYNNEAKIRKKEYFADSLKAICAIYNNLIIIYFEKIIL